MVVPKWPTKPWYSFMQKMIVGAMVEVPVIHDTPYLPSRLRENKDTRGSQHPLTNKIEPNGRKVIWESMKSRGYTD